jgi:MOSC domain-containing protein YiiM
MAMPDPSRPVADLAGYRENFPKAAARVPTSLTAVIEHIFIRSRHGGSPLEQDSVEVVAGAGIRGDRYFDAHDEPGQNITFIEAEEIEAFSKRTGADVKAFATGRNVVTRGVRLNELVGKVFEVGGLRFRGVELCEPCSIFAKSLATGTLPPAAVVKEWVRRAGLRSEALSSGTLAVGARFQVAD